MDWEGVEKSSRNGWAQGTQTLPLQAANQDIWANSLNPARRLAVKSGGRGSLCTGAEGPHAMVCLHIQDRRVKLIIVVLLLPTKH